LIHHPLIRSACAYRVGWPAIRLPLVSTALANVNTQQQVPSGSGISSSSPPPLGQSAWNPTEDLSGDNGRPSIGDNSSPSEGLGGATANRTRLKPEEYFAAASRCRAPANSQCPPPGNGTSALRCTAPLGASCN